MPDDRKNATFDEAAGPARGILQRAAAPTGVFGHARRIPAPQLAAPILHYWMVSWDLPQGTRETVETLPHPNVQLVFTSGEPPMIHGVPTAKFTRVLEGRAQVFGVKFRAGGFRGYIDGAVAALRGKSVNAEEVFGPGIVVLSAYLTSDASEHAKIEAANRYFIERAPQRDEDAMIAASMVELILQHPEIGSVAALSERAGIGERTLQRLFREYVGVSPKWVIRRYRLHELVERLNSGGEIQWAATAAEFGYFDQSHLIRDFRQIAGYAPEQYRRS